MKVYGVSLSCFIMCAIYFGLGDHALDFLLCVCVCVCVCVAVAVVSVIIITISPVSMKDINVVVVIGSVVVIVIAVGRSHHQLTHTKAVINVLCW